MLIERTLGYAFFISEKILYTLYAIFFSKKNQILNHHLYDCLH